MSQWVARLRRRSVAPTVADAGPADAHNHMPPLELVHPIYLDLTMVVSFIAALEGGVVLAGESTAASQHSAHADGGASATLGAPLTSMINLEFSLGAQGSKETSGSEETKYRWQRTGASLFNVVRHKLKERNQISDITGARWDEQLPSGLVEVTGVISEDPIRKALDAVSDVLRLFSVMPKEMLQGIPEPRRQQRSPRDSQRTSAANFNFKQIMESVERLRAELDARGVRDLLLATLDQPPRHAVLTVSRDYLSEQGSAYLEGGTFTVVGKVTQQLQAGEQINLLRRSGLGFIQESQVSELVEKLSTDSPFALDLPSRTVIGPALQILPLAIFA